MKIKCLKVLFSCAGGEFIIQNIIDIKFLKDQISILFENNELMNFNISVNSDGVLLMDIPKKFNNISKIYKNNAYFKYIKKNNLIVNNKLHEDDMKLNENLTYYIKEIENTNNNTAILTNNNIFIWGNYNMWADQAINLTNLKLEIYNDLNFI